MIIGLRRVRYNLFNCRDLSSKQATMPPYDPHNIEAKWLYRWHAVELDRVDLDHVRRPFTGTPTDRAVATPIEWLACSGLISRFVPDE
jgi:hypothetical protein